MAILSFLPVGKYLTKKEGTMFEVELYEWRPVGFDPYKHIAPLHKQCYKELYLGYNLWVC